MGLIFVGVLAGILIGYGLLAPSLARFDVCPPQGCLSNSFLSSSVADQPAAPKAAALKQSPAVMKVAHASVAKPKKEVTAKAKKQAAAKPNKQAAAKPVKPVVLAKNVHTPSKTETPAPDRPAETSDAVLSKAKISIAAKLEDPASAEFGDMKRSIRKNMFGRPVDTICGHVRGKNTSGEDTGERPFLYLVKEDDAYVVDGKENSAAAIAYRNICN